MNTHHFRHRDDWGGTSFARLVRDDTSFWVEWVTTPPEDPYEEHITALRHVDTPAAAVSVARQVLADIRQQLASRTLYTSPDLDEVYSPKSDETTLYVRVSQPADPRNAGLLIGYVAGTPEERREQLRGQLLRQYAEYEQQINELLPLEEARWVLVPEGPRGEAFEAAQNDVFSTERLFALHKQNPDEAHTLFLWICGHDAQDVEFFMLRCLLGTTGNRIWLHDYIDSIPEDEIQAMWQRACELYEAGDGTGDSWMTDMINDPALRDAWLDVAAEQEREKKRRGE